MRVGGGQIDVLVTERQQEESEGIVRGLGTRKEGGVTWKMPMDPPVKEGGGAATTR